MRTRPDAPPNMAFQSDRCARDHRFFDAISCRALAAAERQAVGRLGSVMARPFLII